jgi:xanthine/uracil permease
MITVLGVKLLRQVDFDHHVNLMVATTVALIAGLLPVVAPSITRRCRPPCDCWSGPGPPWPP